ncbi:MAG: RHS repeat protein, partial [Comamonadaceae bacterium]
TLMSYPLVAQAQQILLPNQEYTESSTDLSVQTLAGPVRIQRTWTAGQWYLNPAWANLRLIPDPLDGVLAVERAGSIYERTGSQVSSQSASSGTGATSANTGRIYRFDADNLLQQTTTGWRWYDRLGNSIQYSATGVIQGYTNPYGTTINFTRDAQGRMVGIQDPEGRAIYTLDYDSAGRVTRITDIAGNAVGYLWNAQQQLSEVTDSRGYVWRYAYDARSQIVRRTNPLGDSLEVTYASNPGDIPASTGFAGLGSGATWGGSSSASASSGATKPPTPRNARVASYEDEAGARWTYRIEYNRVRQEYNIAIQRPDGSNSERRYNKEGWLMYASVGGETQFQRIVESATQHRLIDARGQTTTVRLDSNQQPVRTLYPDGSAETVQYDSNGRKLRHTNALGHVSTWRYDARGALVQAIEAVGLPEQRSHRYTYDEWGNALTYTRGAGDAQGTDAATEHYSYDSWGNTRRWTDATGQSWSYTHNARGDVVTETTPLGHTWKAQYDSQ